MPNQAPRLAAAVPYPLALEIAAQFAANTGNVNNLVALGVPPMSATALAAGITGANLTSNGLALAMWPGRQASVIHGVWANP
jgi:hypothetical protein